MPDKSALSDSDVVIAVEIGFRIFRDFCSWTEKASSSSTVLLTLLGTLRDSTTTVSWRASLFFRKLSKEINTPPHGALLQAFSVSILFVSSFFLSHLNDGRGNMRFCWLDDFFSFLWLFWEYLASCHHYKVVWYRRSFTLWFCHLLALEPEESHSGSVCLHFLNFKTSKLDWSSQRLFHL